MTEGKGKRDGVGGALGGLGLVAAMVLCCAGPALVAGGAFAALGGWLRNPLVIILGAAIVAVAASSMVRRWRAGHACCPLPRDVSSNDSERSAAVDRLPADPR